MFQRLKENIARFCGNGYKKMNMMQGSRVRNTGAKFDEGDMKHTGSLVIILYRRYNQDNSMQRGSDKGDL